jgi:hypothetical protein
MNRKYIYAAWLSIATVTEISRNFDVAPLLSIFLHLTYMSGFVYYVFFERSPWVSRLGFGMIGIISLISLIVQASGNYTPGVRLIDTVLCAYVFFRCLVWLKRYESGEVTLE